MQPEDFQHKFDVSHETFATIRLYNELLQKWQKAINLVSGKTLSDVWERHFADSAQLATYISDDVKKIADLGSGAGFPGMVLALMLPGVAFCFVESDQRKCEFLKAVSRETGRIVSIYPQRVEAVIQDIEPDLIVARAFAPLDKILQLTEKSWQKSPDLEFLLLKGADVEAEISVARERYSFDYELFDSQSEGGGFILRLEHVGRVSSV